MGTMFLGGPPLVEAATGEKVTAEELGGAMLHSSVSGCADYFAKDEVESSAYVRSIFETLNIPGELNLSFKERFSASFTLTSVEIIWISSRTFRFRAILGHTVHRSLC